MMLSDRQKAAMWEYGIPEYMHGGIVRYYENGIPPGGFLTAVINNDLQMAVGRADSTNKECLPAYIMWFYNEAPSGTWGYENAVRDYLQKFHDQRDQQITADIDELNEQ